MRFLFVSLFFTTGKIAGAFDYDYKGFGSPQALAESVREVRATSAQNGRLTLLVLDIDKTLLKVVN